MLKLINLLLIFLFVNQSYAIDKNSVFNELKSNYKNIKSIEIIYSNAQNSDIKGELTAIKGNKYRITMGSRIITCDGTNVWNYSIPQKSVLISKFKESKSVSIENLFFTEINESIVLSLSNLNSTKNNSKYELSLKNEKTDFAYKLYLDENKNIKSIYFEDMEEEWIIEKLNINTKINDKFEPKFADDIEIIDLR